MRFHYLFTALNAAEIKWCLTSTHMRVNLKNIYTFPSLFFLLFITYCNSSISHKHTHKYMHV